MRTYFDVTIYLLEYSQKGGTLINYDIEAKSFKSLQNIPFKEVG